MLGEHYGTPVPEGYERMRRARPDAFDFQRAWRGRSGAASFFEGGSGGRAALTLGPRPGPVLGDFRIPVLLGLFGNSDLTPPFTSGHIQDAYFGDQQGTIRSYYSEVSGERIDLVGDVSEWLRVARPDTAYTVGESGLVGGSLGGGGAGNFVYELAQLADARGGTDWGAYDNDGPDGVPNSGDDDGYVDVLAVLQPASGAECGGTGRDDRVWSHRWSLSSAVGTTLTTSTPRAGGGFIRIDDYTIQATAACSGSELNAIGVFTHELGHAFGLPDLYDTDSSNGTHSGVGIWDLMASGSWGCNNASPESPCHMGAWTKSALGWVDVITLSPDTDHGMLVLPPVVTSATVYRVDAMDGSGDYFLLENRQRLGFDHRLYDEGILVWQVDVDALDARWSDNQVNGSDRMGIRLRQADGEDDLGVGRGRGDSGDPFPGATGNPAFHAGSLPAALSSDDAPTGLTMIDIHRGSGDDMTARVLTSFTTVGVRAEGPGTLQGLLKVDGAAVGASSTTFTSAPFVEHVVEAAAGEDLGPGVRRPFAGWADDPEAPRIRSIMTPLSDEEYVASYDGLQYRVSVASTGGVNGVEPGVYLSEPESPDLWFDEGASVRLRALPRVGFAFAGWGDPYAGAPNPLDLVVDAPQSLVADFELVYAVEGTEVNLPAATDLEVRLEVTNGNEPIRWSVVEGELPTGVSLSPSGIIGGAALETGHFEVRVEAVDAIGLPASADLVMDFIEPSIPIEQLTSPFLLNDLTLTAPQITYLNLAGNQSGAYDVGDFRAWLLDHPELPLSADLLAAPYRGTIEIRGADGGGS